MDKETRTQIYRMVMRSAEVQRKVVQVGNDIARAADRISAASGGKARHTIRKTLRPGGRFTVDVDSSAWEEEWGADGVERIAALRRAANGG